MSTVRVVRPRPLGINDRIPVFWAGQEPSQELKQIDGGALYRHLIASSTPAKNRKRKKPERYHAPKEGEAHEHFSPHRKGQEQQANGPIAIPDVRLVKDYSSNQEAAAHHGPMVRGDVHAAPYLRHKELLPGMYEEHQVTEYDADDRDISWLNNINTKNGSQGLFAAAVGLYHQMAQRISRTSSDAAATPSGTEVRLSVEDFEKAIDLLELMHFDAVKAWWDEQQRGPSTSAPQVPEIPPMKRLLPRATALEQLSCVIPDSKLASQLLEYWVRKRQQEGGPLLARIWFEQPWKLVAFAEFVVSDDEDFDEHLPFMAVEPRSAHKNTRTGNQRRRPISDEDALDALHGLRNELEVLRTLADQVRKREKLKRQLLIVSQQETQMRVQLGLSPTAPVPRAAKQQQRAPQARAAGTSAAAAGRAATGILAVVPGRKVMDAKRQAAPPAATAADVSKRLAQAAAVAAAAASPAQGSHGRQTRTAAAAAAAAFQITFTAKKEIMTVGGAAAAEAGPGRMRQSSAAAQQADELGVAADKDPLSSRRSKRRKAAGELAGGDGCSRGRAGARHARKKQQHTQVAAPAAVESGEADDEGSDQPEGGPAGSLQLGLKSGAVDQEVMRSPKRRRLLRGQQLPSEGIEQQQQQGRGRVRPSTAGAAGQLEQAELGELRQEKRRPRSAAAVAAATTQQHLQVAQQEQHQELQQRQQQCKDSKAATKATPVISQKLHKQHVKQRGQQVAPERQWQQQLSSPNRGRQMAAIKACAIRHGHRHADSSDDSDDADYVASEEEELTDEWQLQQLRRGVHTQAGGQRPRSNRQSETPTSESSSSASDEEEGLATVLESDDDFQSRSPRTVRRVEQLQRRNARPSRQQTAETAASAEELISAQRQSPRQQKQQVKQAQLQNSTRNICVNRRHAVAVPAALSSDEDSGSDDGVPTAAAAGAALRTKKWKQQQGEQPLSSHTARRAAAVAHNPVEHAVLRPHNQQQRAVKQADVHHKVSNRPGSATAATATAASGAPVAARSAGAVVRPASGSGRRSGPGRAMQAAWKSKAVTRRLGGSERELRKLGFGAPGPAWQLPSAVTPVRKRR